jgi:hypothetical protein
MNILLIFDVAYINVNVLTTFCLNNSVCYMQDLSVTHIRIYRLTTIHASYLEHCYIVDKEEH